MTVRKWLVLLIFLIFSFVITANFIMLVTYVAAKLYLYVARGISFETYLPGFLKLIKGASFGGIIAGIGCWCIYFKNSKY
ncbi:hypothetical protein YT14_002778 [Salmonella enterica subsp. enterica serovar Oslo]|nr:hypothetical protein [Salmonella enterica subsp. enterica serovar Oslo]